MDTILVFSCEFCENDQKSCFTEYIRANASILSTGNNDLFEIVKKYLLPFAIVYRAWIYHYQTQEDYPISPPTITEIDSEALNVINANIRKYQRNT